MGLDVHGMMMIMVMIIGGKEIEMLARTVQKYE